MGNVTIASVVLVAELAPVQWQAPECTGYSALIVTAWVHSPKLGLFDYRGRKTCGSVAPKLRYSCMKAA